MKFIILIAFLTLIFAQGPQCTYNNGVDEITLTVNTPVDMTPRCIPIPVAATVEPSLPTGVFILADGTLKGAPTVSLKQTTFVITLTGPDDMTASYSLKITVIAPVNSCSYGISDRISIPVNVMISIVGPKCDPAATKFTLATNNLPAGLKLDPLTGGISGKPTSTTSAVTVVIHAANEASTSTVPISVPMIVTSNSNLPPGIMARVSPNKYFPILSCPTEYMTFLDDFENGNMKNIDTHYFSELYFRCVTGYGDCPKAFEKDQFFARFDGVIHAPNTGVYSFRFGIDDCMWLFLDNNFTHPAFVYGYTQSVVTKISMTKGDHPVTFLLFDFGGGKELKVTWRMFSAGILDYTPVGGSFISGPQQPVQFLEYPSSNYIFKQYADVNIQPSFTGSPTEWYVEPNLPEGMTFATGKISGKPTKASSSTRYTITARNGVSITKASIYISVVEINMKNLRPGIHAVYYSCTAVNCWNKVCTGQTKIAERIEESFNRRLSSQSIEGLLSKYGTNLYVEYDTYVNMPTGGTYTFSADVKDTVQFNFVTMNSGDSQYISSPLADCNAESRTASGQVVMSSGPRALNLKWWVGGGTAKQLQFFWAGGPLVMERNVIPSDYYYYIPQSSFTYTIQVAVFMSQIPITAMRPVIFMSASTFNRFAAYPILPTGIVLNPTTGVLSGTPTIESSYRTQYTITATSADRSDTLTTTVEIEVTPLVRAVEINYGNVVIEGATGENIVAKGPQFAPNGVSYYTDELPVGLSIESSTGVISGIPREPMSKTITVYGQSDGGITNTNLQINIGNCLDGSRLFGSLGCKLGSYPTGSLSGVSVHYIHTNGAEWNWQGAGAFHSAEQAHCISEGEWELTIRAANGYDKNYGLGGEYLIRGTADKVYRAGKYTLADRTAYENDLISAFTVVMNDDNPPIIRYEQDIYEMVFYRGQDVYISPIIDYGATSCSLTPTLTNFLTFDNATGVISGYVDQIFTKTQYSIRCVNPIGTSEPVTVSISSEECPGNTISAYVTVNAGSASSGITVAFYKTAVTPASEEDYLIHYKGVNENKVHRQTFCLEPDSYTLVLGGGPDAWKSTDLSVGLVEGDILFYGKSIGSHLLNFTYTHSPRDPWDYSPTRRNNNNWINNFPLGADSFTSYAPGFFPPRASSVTTTYYRTIFTIPETVTLRDIAAFEAAFKYDGGIIAYVNGVEFYRRNLGTRVDASTPATEVYVGSNIVLRRTGAFAENLKIGSNYVAVEVHKGTTSLPADLFSGFFQYILADCSNRMRSNMDLTTTYGTDYNYKNEGLMNLIDGDLNTKAFNRICAIAYYFYFSNGQSEFFNKYSIVNGDYIRRRDPFEWDLLVTADHGATWKKIDHQTDIIWRDPNDPNDETNMGPFAGRKQMKSYYIYGMDRSYDGVMLNVTQSGVPNVADSSCLSSGESGSEMMEFILEACHNKLCPPEGIWSATVAGSESVIECPFGYDGKRRRMCNDLGGVYSWGQEPVFQIACALKNIKDFVVQNGSAILYKDFPVEGRVPTFSVWGAEVEYRTEPDLQTTIPGLLFNKSTAAITGTPKAEVGLINFRIIVKNRVSDELVDRFTLRIETVRCATDGDWPATEQGKFATVQCAGSTRTMTRKCTNGFTPHWETVEDNCSFEEVVSQKTSTAVIVVACIAGVIFILLVGFCVYARASSAKKRATRRGMRTAQAQAAKAAMDARDTGAAAEAGKESTGIKADDEKDVAH